jgi:thiamine phosphate synthase YjbQ (UPF0047 family)
MAAFAGALRFETGGNGQIVDVTEGVARLVGESGIATGVVVAFGVGSTVAVTTM